MTSQLLFSPATSAQTELLSVFAVDNCTNKDKDANPELALLTSDEAVKKAAGYVLSSGEPQ